MATEQVMQWINRDVRLSKVWKAKYLAKFLMCSQFRAYPSV